MPRNQKKKDSKRTSNMTDDKRSSGEQKGPLLDSPRPLASACNKALVPINIKGQEMERDKK